MRALFYLSLLALAYTYAGYPLLALALARLRRRPIASDPWWRPSLSVVIAARDEARVIAAKLESLLAQPWPRDRLEVIVVDDGSRDGTAEVVRGFADRGVKRVALPAAGGKAAALNVGVARARGELLVLTDARQPLEQDALPWLVAPLADPAVGAVSGELSLARGGGGLGIYRRLDDAIRRWESASGSSVGVTGALWALRRKLYTPMPPGTILDDFYLPLGVARRGFRVVDEPRARARDGFPPDPARELGRRTRTLAGNFQLLRDHPWLLSPRANPLFFRLLSHKLLRLLAPLWLATAALANLVLVLRPDGSGFEALCFAGQVIGYGLAAADVPPDLGPSPAARLLAQAAQACRSFVLLHVAVVRAFGVFVRHEEGRLWRDARPSPREASA